MKPHRPRRNVESHQTKRLTVDQAGFVWFQTEKSRPKNSGYLCPQFVQHSVKDHDSFQVLGSHTNIPLVLDLYRLLQENRIHSLEVGNPNLDLAGSGEKVLLTSSYCSISPSLGGWHHFTEVDYHTYQLANVTDQLQQTDLFLSHPLSYYLSFIPHASPTAISRLLALILDPRFRLKEDEDPFAAETLYSYLGLRENVQATLRRPIVSEKQKRCLLVRNCWFTEQLFTKPSFLTYLYLQDSSLASELQISKLFLRYLVSHWLSLLCLGSQKEQLFVPELFFTREYDIRMYKTHVKSLHTTKS